MSTAIDSTSVERRRYEYVDPADGEVKVTHISNFCGDVNDVEKDGPQGFLVETVPGFVIEPHFHRVDQFQIVIQGVCTVGKHQADAVAVHYTDGYTPYGPITSGEEGMSFYTLRATADLNAYWMPGSRAHMKRRARRGLTAQTSLRAGAVPAVDTEVEDSIGPHDDGLCARSYRLGPETEMAGLDPASGQGQYYIVVNGSWRHDGNNELPPGSLHFVAPNDPPAALRSGPVGLDVLMLQFPTGHDDDDAN